MSFPQKVLISVDTSQPVTLLEPIHRMEWLDECDFHLVHVFRLLNYGDGLSFNVTFPIRDDRQQLTEAVLGYLQTVAPHILPYGHKGRVIHECLFDSAPKERICQYIHEHEIDLSIVASRKTKGFFESSFTSYLCRHSPTTVLVIRAKE